MCFTGMKKLAQNSFEFSSLYNTHESKVHSILTLFGYCKTAIKVRFTHYLALFRHSKIFIQTVVRFTLFFPSLGNVNTYQSKETFEKDSPCINSVCFINCMFFQVKEKFQFLLQKNWIIFSPQTFILVLLSKTTLWKIKIQKRFHFWINVKVLRFEKRLLKRRSNCLKFHSTMSFFEGKKGFFDF